MSTFPSHPPPCARALATTCSASAAGIARTIRRRFGRSSSGHPHSRKTPLEPPHHLTHLFLPLHHHQIELPGNDPDIPGGGPPRFVPHDVIHIRKVMPEDEIEKGGPPDADVQWTRETLIPELMKIDIKGVKNIKRVFVTSAKDPVLKADGSWEDQETWRLITDGSELLEIMHQDGVDHRRVFSNHVVDVANVLGIEGARSALVRELKGVMGDSVNSRHVNLLIDAMTSTGVISPITRHGMNRRGRGPIAQASFEETVEIFVRAAVNGEHDNCKGVSPAVMLGKPADVGTHAFGLLLDEGALLDAVDTGDPAAYYDHGDLPGAGAGGGSRTSSGATTPYHTGGQDSMASPTSFQDTNNAELQGLFSPSGGRDGGDNYNGGRAGHGHHAGTLPAYSRVIARLLHNRTVLNCVIARAPAAAAAALSPLLPLLRPPPHPPTSSSTDRRHLATRQRRRLTHRRHLATRQRRRLTHRRHLATRRRRRLTHRRHLATRRRRRLTHRRHLATRRRRRLTRRRHLATRRRRRPTRRRHLATRRRRRPTRQRHLATRRPRLQTTPRKRTNQMAI